MTDRPLIFSGSLPRSKDLLQGWKSMMLADGFLAWVIAGTCSGSDNVTMKGFNLTATNPTSLTVNLDIGVMFARQVVDLNAYSTLDTDTTHSVVKMGVNNDIVPVVIAPPTTSGTSQVFLIQGQVQEVDTNLVTLPFYNSQNPSTTFNGPNNSGASSPTLRQCICKIDCIFGNASTGTPATPTPTQGWTGMWTITVPYGSTSINQGMIARYPNACFLDLSLCDLQDGGGGGGGGGDGQGVTSITAGTGLTGGTITTTGTIALANTAVTAGTYTNSNLTVNAQGQITSIANGSAGSGGGITSITAGGGLTGGTITTSGTIAMAGQTSSGSYTNASITVDSFGRVTSASNGTAGTDYSGQINTINNNITSLQGGALKTRYRLTATLNININGSTGNDTTAAAAISGPNPVPSATPFATLQTAWNTIINAYDVSGQTINFNVANGTYTAGLLASGITGLTNTGTLNIIGNVTTPNSCFINVTNNCCFSFDTGIKITVKGFRLAATQLSGDPTSGCAFRATTSTVYFDSILFDTCYRHMMAFTTGSIQAVTGSGDGSNPSAVGYTVIGNADRHMDAEPGGGCASVLSKVTINSGITCNTWYYCNQGTLGTYQTQFNGTQGNGLGTRYNVFGNGILNNGAVDPNNGPNASGGQILPGNANGVTSSGGQVI